MDYLTNHYKNICEQLQQKINILEAQLNEAGLKKAMKSGSEEEMKKERARQKARKEGKQGLAARAGLRAQQLQTSDLGKSAAFQRKADAAHQSARELGANIEEIDMQLDLDPTLRRIAPTSGSYQY